MISCVVRSIGERTEKWCRRRLATELDLSSVSEVQVVSSPNFPETLRQSLEFGRACGADWHLVVDADVVPFVGSFERFAEWTGRAKDSVSVIQPHVHDKLLGINRPAGVHLYRSRYLADLIKILDSIDPSTRPETSMLLEYEKLTGRKFITVPLLFGCHDFEQWNRDIFRKSFQHGIKHRGLRDPLVSFWLRNISNQEFSLCLMGYLKGLQSHRSSTIDWDDSEVKRSFSELKLDEKVFLPEVIPDVFDDSVKATIRNTRLSYMGALDFPFTRLSERLETFSAVVSDIKNGAGFSIVFANALGVGLRRYSEKL